MSEAQRLAEIIKQKLPYVKAGSLRFWGEWFGRPYDNRHTIISCDSEEEVLRLHFDEGEMLSVWVPRDLDISEDSFQIGDAERVRWEWFYYGRPQIAANRYFEEFAKTPQGIEATTNVDWYQPNLQPSAREAAVQIL